MPKVNKEKRALNAPLWKGPELDGITQSMLSRWLVCKERFRLRYIMGLRPIQSFSSRMEYGQMWHTCEEHHAVGQSWEEPLVEYTKKLIERYPLEQSQIVHWYEVCKLQFPIYVKWWSKNPDTLSRKALLPETNFSVKYALPSGRSVLLRGRWDSVDLIGKGKSTSIEVQENKTKGDIDEQAIRNQLMFDLQSMLYLVALRSLRLSGELDAYPALKEVWGKKPSKGQPPIGGIRYNVVRRPLSGGRGTIRQHKPTKKQPEGESKADFYKRLKDIIEEDTAYYFLRLRVVVTNQDLDRFEREFLRPCLESLCDWYEWVAASTQPDIFATYNNKHYRTPFGLYNPLTEGRQTEVDEYLATGSMAGLEVTNKLFEELK